MEFFLQLNRILESSRLLCNISNLGVTYLEFLILISVENDNLTKKEIADLLLKDKSYISKKIDSLKKRKYISKHPIIQGYSATEKGKDLIKKMESLHRDIIEEDADSSMVDIEVIDSLLFFEKLKDSPLIGG